MTSNGTGGWVATSGVLLVLAVLFVVLYLITAINGCVPFWGK